MKAVNTTNEAMALLEKVSTLAISEKEKKEVSAGIKKLNKQIHRTEFKLNRTLNDKNIAINLLQKSIEDLEREQAIVQAKNEELEQSTALLAIQSATLEEHLHKLELSYSELEQFSYIASHDLKTPLRNIASYAQLLQRRYKDKLDESAVEFIQFIVSGAKHMNAIICDLLEYSRTGESLKYVPTDMSTIIRDVKQVLNVEIAENQAIITTSNLPKLIVNQAGMMQLFQNLISNSIKFRTAETPKIHIESEEKKGHWLFRLRDNGLGMNEAYQAKAFLPFQRLDHLDRPGTGMGLAICKKIVNMHRGEIRFHSQGVGTVFEFTIGQIDVSS